MHSKNNQTQIKKAVIPAAGKGTRLLPLTKAIPKELISLGKKPVLEHIVSELKSAGITECLFIISKGKDAIKNHFGHFSDGVKFDYIYQTEQKGLADAVYYAKDFISDEPFIVALGDSILETNNPISPIERMLKVFQRNDAASVILVEKELESEVSRYGIVSPTDKLIDDSQTDFKINGLVEKPTIEEAPSKFAIAGRYIFLPCIFDYIKQTKPGANGEYQLTDTINIMLQHYASSYSLNNNKHIWCSSLYPDEHRHDIGTFESYFKAFIREIAF